MTPKHAPKGPVKADPLALSDPLAQDKPAIGRGERCTATSKRTGNRCPMPAIRGGTVCRMHGGAAPQVKFAAMERLKALQPKAVTTLETLLDRSEFPTVQMAAVRDVLDRTEGKAPEAIRITGKDDGPLEIVIKKPW